MSISEAHQADLNERIRSLRRNAAALDDRIKRYETLLDRQPETERP